MWTDRNGLPGAWKRLKADFAARAPLRSRRMTEPSRRQQQKYVAPDQLAYADLLDIGVKTGRIALAGMFLIYVLELVAPKVPLSELPHYWSISAAEYVSSTGIGRGWSWLKLVGHGDYLNLLGVAFLLCLTVACCVRVLPLLLRRRDYRFAAIVMLQIAILLLAASGVLGVGR